MNGPLTAADISAGYDNPDWLGYGYLGARRDGLRDLEHLRRLDDRVLKEANARGWTADQFFAWLNSKNGRWTAECWFHAPEMFERDLPKLMVLP